MDIEGRSYGETRKDGIGTAQWNMQGAFHYERACGMTGIARIFPV
jgi:hypothetical protein